MLVVVDTGGTKTLVSSFDKAGKLGEQIKFPTPKDTRQYTAKLRDLLTEKYSDKKIDAIVIAVPGMVKDGVAVWCNNLGWINFDVKSAISGVLNNAPIFIENDANLAGLGETRLFKVIPKQSLYVTISTGIGSGIITDGKINASLSNSEAGHALIEYRGKVQDWENFASGKAILKTYKKYAHDIKSKRTWKNIADRISRGFLAVIPILQPDLIIIGGSIGTYFDKYSDQLQKILKERLPRHIPCPKFVAAKYPELAVIYGCYYYAIDKLSDKSA